jgi:hypothetical protein
MERPTVLIHTAFTVSKTTNENNLVVVDGISEHVPIMRTGIDAGTSSGAEVAQLMDLEIL